jgi:DNA-binding NarL/FixJ family response regulator
MPSFVVVKHLIRRATSMPKHIFIVDDNAVVRRSLRSFFDSQTDCEVCGEAADGADAIEKAKEANPDLIILDFSMPHLNGLDTAAILNPLMPEIPIILFTAFDTAIRPSDASAYGVSAVVSKTQGLNALANQVQRLLA